jgi:hypothetical protein
MPAIINSAPDCIVHGLGARPATDSADFILQAPYLKCQGFMTFGPGSTYGPRGSAAHGAYYALTWIGIVVMVVVIVGWVVYEDRRLWNHVARIRARGERPDAATPGVESPGL